MNWILATRGQKISRASWRMHRSDILPIKNLLHSSRVLRAASSFIYFVFLSTGVVTVSQPRKCVLNQNNELQEASVFCRAVKWWIHVPGGLIITPVFFWLPGPTCCIGRIMRKRECCSIVSFSKKHLKSNSVWVRGNAPTKTSCSIREDYGCLWKFSWACCASYGMQHMRPDKKVKWWQEKA